MAPKKKKGKKGSKAKKKTGDEEGKEEKEQPTVILPTYGWIKITVSQHKIDSMSCEINSC